MGEKEREREREREKAKRKKNKWLKVDPVVWTINFKIGERENSVKKEKRKGPKEKEKRNFALGTQILTRCPSVGS